MGVESITMVTATGWLADLTDLYTLTPSQFDGARTHRAAIESRLTLLILADFDPSVTFIVAQPF